METITFSNLYILKNLEGQAIHTIKCSEVTLDTITFIDSVSSYGMVLMESSTATASTLVFKNTTTEQTEGDVTSGIVLVAGANLNVTGLELYGCYAATATVGILKDNATMSCYSCHIYGNDGTLFTLVDVDKG